LSPNGSSSAISRLASDGDAIENDGSIPFAAKQMTRLAQRGLLHALDQQNDLKNRLHQAYE